MAAVIMGSENRGLMKELALMRFAERRMRSGLTAMPGTAYGPKENSRFRGRLR